MNLAPIVLFVYNRPGHIQRTVEALQKNEVAMESDLFIYSDGPGNQEEEEHVSAVRDYIKTVKGFRTVRIVERERNLGLASSIVSGVTEIIGEYGKIIVMEDDLISHTKFLAYMNAALEKYEDRKEVFSITGYSHLSDIEGNLSDSTYFLKLTSSWSWATWSNKWRYFDKNVDGWEELLRDRKKKRLFNYDNSYDYLGLLQKQKQGAIDSWAICWYWSVFKVGGLTLYPRKSLVKNVGFDGSGTHCSETTHDQVLSGDVFPIELTDEIYEKKKMREAVACALKNLYPDAKNRLLNKIRRNSDRCSQL
ncbi:MAG: glycosyltransferase [Nitrospirae bacterium]|nr:glycosyltransferase [Nitrospirota bacterium]